MVVQEQQLSNTDDPLPTRQTLLSRLKDRDDQESWRDFFDTYWKLIFNTALKAGLKDAEAQEVVQDTVICVCEGMDDFTHNSRRGAFKKWLLTLTRHRIIDQLRKRKPVFRPLERERHDTRQTATLERIPDPVPSLDEIWEEEWKQNLMETAIERVKRQVDPKHYQIFDLYVLRQWPVAKISKALEISKARIYMAKHRVEGLIKNQIKLLESRKI